MDFIVLEGGELFHQIVKLTYFSENLARHVILQVAQGIRYLHEERGVVHRDIKPENLLFERIPIIPSKNPAPKQFEEEKEDEGEFVPGVGGGGIGRVKIADFGLSKVVWDEQTMTPCGTVGYTAPEIVKDERYSKSVDMWALGCVLYTLLCGFPPFYDESINVLTEKVARGHYTFLSPWWDSITDSGKFLSLHGYPFRVTELSNAIQPKISSRIFFASIPLRDIRSTSSLRTRGVRPHPSLFPKPRLFPLARSIHPFSQQPTEEPHAKRAHQASHSSKRHSISPTQSIEWRKKARGDERRRAGQTEGSSASLTRATRTKVTRVGRRRRLRRLLRRGMGTMGGPASGTERGRLTRLSSWIWTAPRFWEGDTGGLLADLLGRVHWQEPMA